MDQQKVGLPFQRIHKRLGEDIRALLLLLDVLQCNGGISKVLHQPTHTDVVSAVKMTQRGVAPALHDLDHGLVVLLEVENQRAIGESLGDGLHQICHWQSFRAERSVRRDNRGFKRTMRGSRLLLGLCSNGEERIGPLPST